MSVVIVTQNCAEQLRIAMGSIESVADEFIVVDGGSHDQTKEVALSFRQTRYIKRTFRDDIADQKNFAIDQASCDWVFVPDSDEVVGKEFRAGVRRWIQTRLWSAYRFPRYWLISLEPQRHVVSARIYPDFQLRLFRNHPFWRYRRVVNSRGGEEGSVHHQFPITVQGRGILKKLPAVHLRGRGLLKKLPAVHLYHLDYIYNDRKARERKVERYDVMEPHAKTTHRHYYLFEDFPFETPEVDYPLDGQEIDQANLLGAAVCGGGGRIVAEPSALAEDDSVMRRRSD